MNPHRLIAAAGLCALSVAAVAVGRQGGSGGSHGGGGGQGSGGGHVSSGAQTSGLHVTRYDNPRGLHYLEPASGYETAKYEGCGSARSKPGCVPTQARALQSLRDQGLRLQREDGGTLTPEHRAELQSKLDAIRAQSK
jgi:hypothetical protein